MKSTRIFLSPPYMAGDEEALVQQAFASKYIAPCGPMVERFERDFAAWGPFPAACALSSGTDALTLLFHQLGIAPGDRVICSDLTFIASIAPAVLRGAEPIFVDSDPASWNMDPELLEEVLDKSRKEGRAPKAIVAVDLYGQCADYDRLEELSARYGVPLIVDAAEALGARYWGNSAKLKSMGGKSAGSAGTAALFSFNGNKIITTSGGGMLVSRNVDLVNKARKLSQQARDPACWYEHTELGYNFRMSNITAAIGVGQFLHLPEFVAKKRQIFSWYRELLGDLPEISFMPEAPYGFCNRWLTVIQLAPTRAEKETSPFEPAPSVMHILRELERENIETRPVWKPMHLQPVFREASFCARPGNECGTALFRKGLCLPSGVGLTRDQAERVSTTIHRALR